VDNPKEEQMLRYLDLFVSIDLQQEQKKKKTRSMYSTRKQFRHIF